MITIPTKRKTTRTTTSTRRRIKSSSSRRTTIMSSLFPLSSFLGLLSLLLFLLVVVVTVTVVEAYLPVEFSNKQVKDAENLVDLKFVSRIMLPYGPNLSTNPPQDPKDFPWTGYAFGMGMAEEMAYDYKNHYAYVSAEAGFVNVVDYSDPSNPKNTNLGFQLSEESPDVETIVTCSDRGLVFFICQALDQVHVYNAVNRKDPQTPTLRIAIDTEPKPTAILPNFDCTILAVAHENTPVAFENESSGLDRGSVAIVRNVHTLSPTITKIPYDDDPTWDDDYMLRKGLHMPLTKNALEYWDEYSPIADEVDFSQVRKHYVPAIFLDLQSLAWANPEGTELLVNMQTNNGLIRVDVTNNKATAVASYGLRDHSKIPVDIQTNDQDCIGKTYRNLFALRNPDSIATIKYNDKVYLLTANEGQEKSYEGYSEIYETQELFNGPNFTLPQFEIEKDIFDPSNPLSCDTALFNSICEGPDCVRGTDISVGSTAIDYESDPTNPIFYRMVLFGGRGWSIYEVPKNPDDLLKLVFDSGDYIEKAGCQAFPWAHNGIQDYQYGPGPNFPNNTFYETTNDRNRGRINDRNDPTIKGCIDQGDGTPGACPMKYTVDVGSNKEGPQVERLVPGVACGRLLALAITEKNSIAFLFDITNISSPTLKKVFHLSEASKEKSAGLAYNDGTIGELDAEQFTFLSESESPTGKAAFLIAGAYTGTLSLWEIECQDDDQESS